VAVSCWYEKLVAEARGQFGKPEEVGGPLLEAAIKQRLAEGCNRLRTLVLCRIVICDMW
jgi:hypothetical protein